MKNIMLIVITLLITFVSFSACEKKENKEEGAIYTCPMHPEIKKSEPGSCPICKMDLVKMESKE